MENKKIVKKSALYFIGNFSSKILSSLLVPLYAFYISSEDLGTYDYSQTILNIVIPIIFVSIWEAIIRFILGNKDGENKDKEFASSAFFVIIMCVLFIIGTLIIGNFVEISYIQFFIPMVCAHALSQIWQYYSRASQKNKLYVFTSVVSTVVNLLLNLLLIIVFNMRIEALYISYIASNIITFLILEYKLRVLNLVRIKNIDFKLLKKMIIYSAPLVVNSIATWVFNGFGRIIIFENLGASSNGLYSFANKFVTIVTTIGSVVSMAILEEAMISLKENKFDENYPKVLEQVFNIFLSLIIVAMPAISIFYSFIDATEYYESLNLLPFLLLYSVFLTMSINFGVIFKTINKNKYQVITTITSSIVMLIVSYVLLEKLGVYAVALGQLLSTFTMLISRYFMTKRFVQYTINWKPVIFLIIIYSIISFVSIMSITMLTILAFIVGVAIALIINKEFILSIFKGGKFHVSKFKNKN